MGSHRLIHKSLKQHILRLSFFSLNSGFQPKMKKYGLGEMELGDILDCAYELVGEENRLKTQEAFIAGMMFYRCFF